MTTTQLALADPTRTRCDNDDRTGADFSHYGHNFCAECMAALISWLLDGGVADDPDLFAWVYEESK